MATNTSKTYLMYKATPEATDYTKLVDIKTVPDLPKAPDKLDTTTLSDTQKTSIMDIADVDNLEFDINYDPAVWETIAALKGKQTDYAIYFGDNGEYGYFTFTADTFIAFKSAKVSAVREATITLYPSTALVHNQGPAGS